MKWMWKYLGKNSNSFQRFTFLRNDDGEYIAKVNYEYYKPEDDDMEKSLMFALENVARNTLEEYEEPIGVNPSDGASFSYLCSSVAATVMILALL